MSEFPISGDVAPGYEAVRAAIETNFAEHKEIGCQVAIFKRGTPVVDICAGWTDRKKTDVVTPDTLFSVYSSGKAMAALVIALLVERGLLDYDAPIARYWPEFAAHGKETLSVAQMMSHQSGLSGITDPEFAPADWIDFDAVVAVLEAQDPLFAPGSQSGYHPITFGFLAGELARRVDPKGRRLGQILADDLAGPARADVHIGLDPADHARVARQSKPTQMADLGEINDATRAAFLQKWSNPSGISGEQWREAEMAGSNCQATARGIGAMMGLFVDGQLAGEPLLSGPVRTALTRSRIKGPDAVVPFTVDYAAGVMRNAPNFYYGPNPDTVGHSGWGGSAVFADPVTGLHGAYVMNRQQHFLMGDPRANAVINAAYEGP